MKLTSVDILPNLSIRIPTVGEVLDDEQHYYGMVSALTATPYQYMVQLDDMGLDFTQVTDYQLFMMLFPAIVRGDMSILFGNMDLSDICVKTDTQNGCPVLYSPKNQVAIDEFVYIQIVDVIRKINNLKRENRKPGNNEAKKFLINWERKKQKRNVNKPYHPYMEKLVVALVNRPEFKYDYKQVNDLTIYQFNKSFEQIKNGINFDKIMFGVYMGTIDVSKLADRSSLSWIPVV